MHVPSTLAKFHTSVKRTDNFFYHFVCWFMFIPSLSQDNKNKISIQSVVLFSQFLKSKNCMSKRFWSLQLPGTKIRNKNGMLPAFQMWFSLQKSSKTRKAVCNQVGTLDHFQAMKYDFHQVKVKDVQLNSYVQLLGFSITLINKNILNNLHFNRPQIYFHMASRTPCFFDDRE